MSKFFVVFFVAFILFGLSSFVMYPSDTFAARPNGGVNDAPEGTG